MNSGAKESPIHRITVSPYIIPTDFPESDGTLEWDKTTLVLVEATSGGSTGIGYTYASTAVAALIRDTIIPIVVGLDAMSPTAAYEHDVEKDQEPRAARTLRNGNFRGRLRSLGPESPPVANSSCHIARPAFAPALESTVAADLLRTPMRN